MSTLLTTDPRSGSSAETGIEPTSPESLTEITSAAATAFAALRRQPRAWRAGLLEALADGLEQHRDELVATAMSETGLAQPRLEGEVARSVFQFRLFAAAVREGGYLEAMIDHAGATPLGVAPDVRRMLVPLGPVAVFGSSNFPFAFSVAGGDTASALAAGNPVIAKAHGSHLLTSLASFRALNDAATAYGAPAGTLGIVFGQTAGASLVAHPAIAAVGFTGSQATGEILLDIIARRERPIPFYGELSSLNPLIVTEAAANTRGDAIADGLFASVAGSAGQLCTKPGLAFIPRSAEGIVAAVVAHANAAEPQSMLNRRIFDSFAQIEHRLVVEGGAEVLVGPRPGDAGFGMTPVVLQIDAERVTEAVAEEAFGPLVVIVRYDSLDEVRAALDRVPHSLTATVHAQPEEHAGLAPLLGTLQDAAGRIVFDGFPTGVRVSWAQHHGGPWPATNTLHTSVGVTAIRRFLRPLAWQDAPQALLPDELRDDCSSIPRRIDGVLTLATLTG